MTHSAHASRQAFVAACRDAIGAQHVLTEPHDTAPFLTDWRRRYEGAAWAVLRPASTEEVAPLVRLALQHPVAPVPQRGNPGYDLRDLSSGAEGPLGLTTAAVMKLHPQPAARVTALAALASPHAALDFLALAQRLTGPLLTGFELMSDFCLRLVGKHFPQLR